MYLEQKVVELTGWWTLMRFRKDIKDIKNVQEQTLMDILKTGSQTKFGRDHNLKNIANTAEFREKVPLSCYDDYRPYIEAIMNGEKNLLFHEQIDFFGATSGTTSGKSKLFPLNVNKLKINLLFAIATSFAMIRKHIPSFGVIKPIANVRIGVRFPTTETGIEKGSISAKLMPYRRYLCSPSAAYDILTEKEGLYIHAVFTLKEPDVTYIMCLTSSVLLSFLLLIKRQWKQLVRDIRLGQLDPDLNISDSMRKKLEKSLRPDPKRADELTGIFHGNSFINIVPRLWTHCSMVSSLATGTFELQANIVRAQFGQTVPIVTFMHAATEGQYGIVVFDEGITKDGVTRADFVPIPRAAFFEFIPLEDVHREHPRTLLAHQVIPGSDYELVVTNSRGLYRYRTQDVIRIVGFRNTAPVYNVRQRTTDVLNVRVEKVPESVVTEAVVAAAATWNSGCLTNFSATEKINCDKLTDNITGEARYVFFVELDTNTHMTEVEKSQIDAKLYEICDTYRAFRNNGTIQEPEVIQVAPGTFDVIKQTAVNNNSLLYIDQFKWPRILRKPDF
ncbi:probable indole-3-acetic acid-amido synthetase GH3.11 [Gigantopelta aegis]|uniref:probable indole-3-acetic acid-amido synthetase GH3.11 n=1 Tax=Gigantopelta aegis TaxID=1735272 RepID=UPI001B88AF09|nr:probable indole-3-acetic acid-amido synthetase GH3.11 [Gigantopelta aegis]